jgi:hypothetical protein
MIRRRRLYAFNERGRPHASSILDLHKHVSDPDQLHQSRVS